MKGLILLAGIKNNKTFIDLVNRESESKRNICFCSGQPVEITAIVQSSVRFLLSGGSLKNHSSIFFRYFFGIVSTVSMRKFVFDSPLLKSVVFHLIFLLSVSSNQPFLFVEQTGADNVLKLRQKYES